MYKIHTFNPIFEYGGPDFESNISASFRKLREDNDFFDVTLCCDNDVDMVQAHEVILFHVIFREFESIFEHYS